eukprot:TRINITY_DN27735_c0_g1_i1.p1 TRINITY_DN27735_c0_g1~~TRINITY_DN27735_c0_g1_i1.p1  ORF type:complete len:1123 (+),score=337.23 TRINITY_DN27735_c0_g1_i1:119-3487(+)
MPLDINSLEATIERIRDNEPNLTQIYLAGRRVDDDQCKLIFEALKANSAVRVADLQNNKITAASAEFIADCLKGNMILTDLNLTNNDLGDAGARLIDEALDYNFTLTVINLDLNTVSGRLEERIQTKVALNKQPRLFKTAYWRIANNEADYTALDLSIYDNVPFNCTMLVDALRFNTHLHTVNLANVNVKDKGAESMARLLLSNTTIRKMNLANNGITAIGVKDLAEALMENTALEWLNLEGNRSGDDGARAMVAMLLKNDTLMYLNLQQNRVSAKLLAEVKLGIEVNNNPRSLKKTVAAAAANKSDQVINFSMHGTMKQSATMLADALRSNTTTTMLNLTNNLIGDGGARALAEVLRTNRTLKVLGLSNNNITMYGAKALSEALVVNGTVTDINLANNRIGTEGAKFILACLEHCHSVVALNLELNDIAGALLDEIEDAVELNLLPLTLKRLLPSLRANDEKIRALDFSQSDGRYHTDKSVKTLARALRMNTVVTRVDLSHNNVGNQGAAALADVLKANHVLTAMDLSYNAVGNRGSKDLAEALGVNRSLSSLNLDNNNVSDQGCTAFVQALQTNHTVKVLTLFNNKVSPECLEQLINACRVNNTPITLKELVPKLQARDRVTAKLDLSQHGYDDTSLHILCSELESGECVTKSLNLSSNTFTLSGVQHLARVLASNGTLLTLDLSSNRIGDDGAALLAQGLEQNTTLQCLVLQHCGVTNRGVESFLDALGVTKNSTLLHLYLEGNAVDLSLYQRVQDVLSQHSQPSGFKELLSRLEGNDPSLTKLNFSDTEKTEQYLDDTSCRLLAIALLSNRTLTKLNVSNNKVGPEGARYLADMLEENTGLTELNLNNNHIGDDGARALSRALRDRNDTCQKIWVESNGVSEEAQEELVYEIELNNVPPALKRNLTRLRTNDRRLQVLDFCGKYLGERKYDDGAMHILLRNMKENTSVTEIDLSYNEITDNGAQYLAMLVRNNRSLRKLDLSYNQIGAGASALAKAVMSNPVIDSLSVEGNPVPQDALDELRAAVSINDSRLLPVASSPRREALLIKPSPGAKSPRKWAKAAADSVGDAAEAAAMEEYHSLPYYARLEDDILRDAFKARDLSPRKLLVQYGMLGGSVM